MTHKEPDAVDTRCSNHVSENSISTKTRSQNTVRTGGAAILISFGVISYPSFITNGGMSACPWHLSVLLDSLPSWLASILSVIAFGNGNQELLRQMIPTDAYEHSDSSWD